MQEPQEVFVFRFASPSLVLALVVLAAACGGDSVSPEELTPGPPSADLHLIAEDLEFNRKALAAIANSEVSLTFANEDGVPHNVAIYTDKDADEEIYVGETFTGDSAKVYSFTTPGPGTYYFRCDVHPNMNGNFFVQ
jgi:plastocyanin